MTHDDAFLQSIIADPEDDTPRLVYADWLDENGQADRAEFIRVQCELARMVEDDSLRQIWRRKKLEARELTLLLEYQFQWAEPLERVSKGWKFRRGFIESIAISADDFLQHGQALFSAAPIRETRLYWAEGRTGSLAACPHLRRLTALDLGDSQIGDSGLRELLPSSHMGRLRSLGVRNTEISSAGLHDLLASSERFPDLDDLDIGYNKLGDDGARALAASPLASRLKRLGIHGFLVPAGVRTIADSQSFTRLSSLGLEYTRLGDEMGEVLAASTTLSSLQTLRISVCEIGDRGVKALASSRYFPMLKTLNVDNNAIGDDGAEALASAASLPSLRNLCVGFNRIGVRGLRALLQSPLWPKLVSLGLAGNLLGDEGARELLAAPKPRGLTWLPVERCGISESLIEALRKHFDPSVCTIGVRP